MGNNVKMDLKLDIDENDLLNEWRGQAMKVLDYGIQLADARQEEDEIKAELSITIANLDREIREKPEEYGLKKITEGGVANVVLGQPAHQAVQERLREAQYDVRIIWAAIDALSHRKAALQGITDIYKKQWFTDQRKNTPDTNAYAEGPPTKQITRRKRRKPAGK